MPQQTSYPCLNIVSISRSASDLLQTYISAREFIRTLSLPSKHILVFDSTATLATFNSLVHVDHQVTQLVQELPGISHAFNYATQYLSPGYVLYLNAGDIFASLSTIDHYELSKNLSQYDLDLIICKSKLLPSTVIPRPYVKYASTFLWLPFILARLPHQATFINTKHIHAIPYMPSLRVRMDYSFFYALLQQRREIAFLDILLSFMSPGGISSNLSAGYAEEFFIHKSLDNYPLIHQLRISLTQAIKSSCLSLLAFLKYLAKT